MLSTINVCFMCINDKNCTDISEKALSLVEYILPEITIIKLDVNLRICSICEETISLFSKFKGSCLKNSKLLETTIKKAQSYRDRVANPQENNTVTSTTPKNRNGLIEDEIIDITADEDVIILEDDAPLDKDNKNVDRDDPNVDRDDPKVDQDDLNVDQDDPNVDQFEDDTNVDEIWDDINVDEIWDDKNENDDDINVIEDDINIDIEEISVSEETSKKNYSCRICRKIYKHKCNAISHIKLHRGLIEYKCAECNKEFENRSKLLEHVLIHTDTKNKKSQNRIPCTLCNKSFTYKCNLAQHMKTHTKGYKNIGTEKLARKLATMRPRKEINYREIKGSETRRYRCAICNKRFTKKDDLQYHVIWHGGKNN